MANQLQTKSVEQEVVLASGLVQRSPVVSNGNNQASESNRKDDRLPMVYTSALSSNLSQLAELAASQAPSQMVQFGHSSLPQFPPAQIPGITKYIVPGQNVPLPLGPQQSQIAMYGPLPSPTQVPPQPTNIPPPFQKGSIIQLKSGELKRVEDLKTEDFVHSVNLCPELKLETSTVMSIRKNDTVGMSLIGFSIDSSKSQVTLSCAVEHPFFVCEQGWASCVPEKSQQKFNLKCNSLKVGDMCIFLSPNAIPVPVSIPQGQIISSPRLPLPPGSKPGQSVQTNSPNQPQVMPDNLRGPTPLSANTIVIEQTPPPATASPISQAVSAAQASSSSMTTVSGVPTSAAFPPGSTLFYDPQLGVLRPQNLGGQFLNQHVIGTMIDGKTVSLQGGLPPYYQTVPASLVGSMPSQSVVQSSGIQGNGNGLLVTTVGLVPGMNQPGMVYASQLSEIAQKQGLEAIQSTGATEPPMQSDTGPPGAKRPKLDGQ